MQTAVQWSVELKYRTTKSENWREKFNLKQWNWTRGVNIWTMYKCCTVNIRSYINLIDIGLQVSSPDWSV